MNRFTAGISVCLCASVIAVANADDGDPVKAKLESAKLAYDAAMTNYQKAVIDHFDRIEKAARDKDGSKELVEQIKVGRKAFDEKGELPKLISFEIKYMAPAARASMQAAYETAIKEYTKARKDDDAATIQKELIAFKKVVGEIVIPLREIENAKVTYNEACRLNAKTLLDAFDADIARVKNQNLKAGPKQKRLFADFGG